jgi:hypothetical protein
MMPRISRAQLQLVRDTPALVAEAYGVINSLVDDDEMLYEAVLADLEAGERMVDSDDDWVLSLGPLAAAVRTVRYAVEGLGLPRALAERLRQHEDGLVRCRDEFARGR